MHVRTTYDYCLEQIIWTIFAIGQFFAVCFRVADGKELLCRLLADGKELADGKVADSSSDTIKISNTYQVHMITSNMISPVTSRTKVTTHKW